MRIAYISADPGVPVFGHKGCSVHVQEVIRALCRTGARVELFAARVEGAAPPGLGDVRIHVLPAGPRADLAARERAARQANGDLRAALEQAGPFDVVYERYSLWSFAGMEYTQDQGIPGLLEVNAPLIEEQARHRGLADRDAAEQTAARSFAAASALLAVSRGVVAYLEDCPGARGRIHLVPNGVDAERFAPGLAPARVLWGEAEPGSFTVGFVGTLKPWHGLPVLLEAFALLYRRYPRSRLLIVGDGPERASLEADLEARGVATAAHLTGAVSSSEVPGLLASMDVAVAPYPALSAFYFSPLKVYEYMAAGLPVVASRIGDLEELIADGTTGLLCRPGDAVELAEALDQLRRQPDLRRRLGRAARSAVLAGHTWDAVVRRILDLACQPAALPGKGVP